VIVATFRILVYGVIAGLSPLALAGIFAVLGTERGRVNGALFTLGFVLAETLVCLVFIAIGSASIGSRDQRETVVAVGEIVLGVAMILTALRARRAPPEPPPLDHESRTAQLLARLSRLNSREAGLVGAALGVGGPKRLALTVLAAGTISAATVRFGQKAGLVAIFVAVATVLVWVPTAMYLGTITGGPDRLEQAQTWLEENSRELTSVPLLVFGVLLIVIGALGLR
jgi:hypothetical protein